MKNKLLSLLVFCTMMGCNSKDANQSQKVANNAASQAQDYPTTIPESNPASAPTTNDNKNSINTLETTKNQCKSVDYVYSNMKDSIDIVEELNRMMEKL